MIIGIIHKGSGLGDQLFSYIATRVRAADLGVNFGFVGKEFFKGSSFMNLDWGKEIDWGYEVDKSSGVLTVIRPMAYSKPFVINKPYYDPEFNFIPDGSIIDGYGAQDIRYFEHRLSQVWSWLKTETVPMPDYMCAINFRGGEFQAVPELFLPKEYWDKGIQQIKEINSLMRFEVHTDDGVLSKKFFPDFNVYQNIEMNWKAIRNAKVAIISNSAFAIIPRLLKHLEDPEAVTIAPKYWNRRNIGRWDWPGNYYKKFNYI